MASKDSWWRRLRGIRIAALCTAGQHAFHRSRARDLASDANNSRQVFPFGTNRQSTDAESPHINR